MAILAVCYFVAGSLIGAWVHLAAPKRAAVVATSAATIPSIPAPVASSVAAAAGQPFNPLSKFSAKIVSYH